MAHNKYKAYQRLVFVHKTNDDCIYIRAKLLVPLYENEKIGTTPSVSTVSGHESNYQFEVSGNATGDEQLYYMEYIIPFIDPFTGTTDAQRKEAVESELDGNRFFVNTIIHKNPSESVENTIEEDEDIEVEG